MRVVFAIMVLVAACACKGDRDASERSGSAGATSGSASDNRRETTSRALFKPGDDSAAGYVLGVLAALDAPRLSGDPACADYAANLRSLSADMSQTLRRLRHRGQTGVPLDELLVFAGWLDKRAGMLEQLSRARAMADDELGRRHREFAAAASDLAGALGESYSSRQNELEPAEVTRLRNAADNFAATIRALEEQCQGQ